MNRGGPDMPRIFSWARKGDPDLRNKDPDGRPDFSGIGPSPDLFAVPRFVVCIENAEYPASLELHKIYRMVADADASRDGDVRMRREDAVSSALDRDDLAFVYSFEVATIGGTS